LCTIDPQYIPLTGIVFAKHPNSPPWLVNDTIIPNLIHAAPPNGNKLEVPIPTFNPFEETIEKNMQTAPCFHNPKQKQI